MPTTNQSFWPDYAYTAHDETYGTDIDKMLLSAPASNDLNTKADFGSSEAKSIILDPNTTNSTNGTANLSNYGWAINNSDVGSIATAKRKIISGTWTIEGEAIATSAALNAVSITFSVYRVAASPSFTRTELFNVNTGSLGTLAVRTSFSVTKTGVAEVILEAGEVIQISGYVNGTGQLGGIVVSFNVGQGGAATNPKDTVMTLPANMGYYYLKTFTGVMKGIATFTKKMQRTFTAVMLGVASFSRLLSLHRTASAVMLGVSSFTKRIQRTFSAVMLGVPTFNKKLQRTFTAVMLGVPTFQKKIKKTFTAVMKGVAIFSRLLSLHRTASARMAGVAIFARKLTAARTASAVMKGVPTVFVKFTTTILSRITSGGSTVINYVFSIFD